MMKKKELNQSSKIDRDIRRLLFANPSLGMTTCQRIVQALMKGSYEKKESIRDWLEDSVAIYKSKARKMDSPALYDDLCKNVIKHIETWEEEFGRVSLGDILFLTESTDIRMADVGWNYLNPAAMVEMLGEYIVGQEAYKKELCLTVYTHMLRIHKPELNIPKMNLLVYGPSGSGKTSGVKILVDKLGIRSGIANCERLVPEGIQGTKLSDPLTRVLGEEGDDMIYVADEFDKLFLNQVFDGEIQRGFLSLMDGNNVISFPSTFGVYREYREVPSKNITCILCGKFESLTKAVEERLDIHKVGFRSEQNKKSTQEELYAQVTMTDLRKAIGSDELCRRIGSIVGVSRLSKDEMISIIMNSRESAFSRYKAYFQAHQAKIRLTMEGARLIVDHALALYPDLGVSGTEIVFRNLLKDEMMCIESLHGRDLEINQHYVEKHLKGTRL